MAAGLVTHNFTTASGVTFTVNSWVPDTSAPDVGAIPVMVQLNSAGSPAAFGSGANGATVPRVALATDSPGVTALGQAGMAASLPTTLASDQSTIAIAADTSKIANGASGTNLTPKFAKIAVSSSGVNIIVAAVTSKKIRVLQWIVKANAAVNFKWQSHTTPTDLTGLFYNSAQGDGAGGAFCPVGHFETVAGESLDLNLSGAVAVGGYLIYVEV